METKGLSFPEEEYEDRRTRLKEKMRELELDVALVSCRTNLRWLTGFSSPLMASRFRSFVAVVSVSGELTLIVPPDVWAASTALVDEFKRWDVGETTCTKAAISAVRERLGSRRARIGVELGQGTRLEMCQQEADDLRGALEAAEIVDLAPALWKLRVNKSPAEIKKVERACALTDQAWMEVFPRIEPGISERQLEVRINNRMVKLGGEEGFMDIVMGPERLEWANNASRPDRRLLPDDLVCVDGGCRVDGYHCDINRVFSIKRPSDDVLRVCEAIVEANRVTTARLAPGMTGAEVYAICAEEMKRHGLADILNSQCVVHSVGLDLHEPPECGPYGRDVLLERMTVSVEPWSVHPELSLFNVEDMAAIDGDSVRRITSIPQGIYCVEEQRWLASE